MLADRRHAGRALARRLEHLRGSVLVGFEVARALGVPLDLLLVRQLRA